MSPHARVTLAVGGILHAMLVYAAALGILYSAVRLYTARANQLAGFPSEPISPEGITSMAMLIVAALFGWFCLRLAVVAMPWRVEVSAVTITTPLTLVVTFVGGLAVAVAGLDQSASYLWYIGNGVGAVLFGAITFYVLGRRHDSRARTEAEGATAAWAATRSAPR